MRKTITAVISAALLTGLGAALAPAASASTRPVYYAPTWNAEVRPGNIVFGADGGIWVRYLRWQHWNATSAYATGRLWANTCNPTCSAGHYKKYRSSVNLWRVRDHRQQPYYTRMTLRYWKNGRRLTHIYTLGGNGPQ
jgi:hypothetical protein